MAKKGNELTYMQMPLPKGRKYTRTSKFSWSGLNKRQTIDTGELSAECNISTAEAPYLVPAPTPKEEGSYAYPLGMFAFEDFLFVMYIGTVKASYRTYYYEENKEKEQKKEGSASRVVVLVDYIRKYVSEEGTVSYNKTYTGIVKLCDESSEENAYEAEKDTIRSVVQFNAYDTPTDPVTGQYVKKLLIFPDAKSMYMNITEVDGNPEEWEGEELNSKDRYALYHYTDEDKYYSISLVEDTADGDENKVSYKREVIQNNVVTEIDHADEDGTTYYKEITYDNHFCCDAMGVLVKEFAPWIKTDEEGNKETMNVPPESASQNYYYRNKETNDVYRWADDMSDPENSAWKVCAAPAVPPIKYAAVHLSRVFGVSEDRVYASGYNDYTNWNLDTVAEYNEANAWCSPAQSNTKAGGKITGITVFDNHVVCFKNDFMHEIYNTKNPFRIQDIYAEGAIDYRTIQEVDGNLIFVSADYVKVYTGGNPRIIDYNLNMSGYTYEVSGTYVRCYYLYCEDSEGEARYFVFDTLVGEWSERKPIGRVINFAHNTNGMFMLCENTDKTGLLYRIDTSSYENWWCETDLTAKGTIEIKHLRKVKMLADIGAGATLKIYALYDNEEWSENAHLLFDSKGRKGRIVIRVKPRMTANYGVKIHICGSGFVKVYEMETDIEMGGELFATDKRN